MKKTLLLAGIIFLLAFGLRLASVWPDKTILGFDQARDLFNARQILQGDLKIIGPTAGNNPSLHHGVVFWYFLVPPLLLGGNPIWPVLWNSLFNAAGAVFLFFFAESLFRSRRAGIIAGLLAAVSNYLVQFSGWLSNPTATLFTVPVFFFGIWQYFQKKSWGLPLAMFFLGLSIQFELFFVYLIPVGLILWLILWPKFPSPKTLAFSLLTFTFAMSSMLATEIKFGFAGVKSLLSAGSLVGGTQSFNWGKFFALDLIPQNKTVDIALGILTIGFFVFELIKNANARKRNLFILVWLFSPLIMFVLGTHNAPWFLIGRPAAAILMTGCLLAKIKNVLLLPLLLLIVFFNLSVIKGNFGQGQPLLEPDPSSILAKQIKVMNYTYQTAKGEPFAIDTVTNPLYINAVWAWNYGWYGKKYGYKPGWLGGDQLPPYNTLSKATGEEKYLFLIIDTSPRIPPVYIRNAIVSLAKKASFVEEKDFEGLKVLTWQNNQ